MFSIFPANPLPFYHTIGYQPDIGKVSYPYCPVSIQSLSTFNDPIQQVAGPPLPFSSEQSAGQAKYNLHSL